MYKKGDKSNNLRRILVYTFFIFAFVIILDFRCIFKSITSLPCPGCGMTRAFIEILKMDFINSFKYNIFALPLVIFYFVILGISIFDKFRGTHYYSEIMKRKLSSFEYSIIFAFFVVGWILNIVRGI